MLEVRTLLLCASSAPLISLPGGLHALWSPASTLVLPPGDLVPPNPGSVPCLWLRMAVLHAPSCTFSSLNLSSAGSGLPPLWRGDHTCTPEP